MRARVNLDQILWGWEEGKHQYNDMIHNIVYLT